MNKTRKNIKVLQYNAVFEQEKDGGYSVWVPSLPGCCSQGDNFEKAVNNIKEAMGLYLEDRIQTVTVPNHREIRKGTLRNGILKPINLTVEEFIRLL